MKREKLTLKTRVIFGVVSGLFFAISMAAVYYYIEGESFHIGKFLFNGMCFGFFMAFIFRNKYKKNKH